MKQVLQSLKNGRTEVASVPRPAVSGASVLIESSRTLVSLGTERMLIDFGKAGLFGKALQQPDKVRMVLDKIRTDGLLSTAEAVFNKLDQPLAMGYCNVGTVKELGRSVTGLRVGDRVVSNGKHAEFVCVSENLCTRVPEIVSDDEAAFAVVAAIGLQGIRLVQPTLGETVVVTGLGLIGLLTVQLLRAQGCRVIGLDFDAHKLALAQRFGAEVIDISGNSDPIPAANAFSRGRGVDAVIITAATRSSEPVHQAALMCRKRGRIVLVGVTGLELSRADFYAKELSFQVSCSYGPGRYDPAYEEEGCDYPIGYVRWTEQRNFEAVLDMMAEGRLDVKPLISHRFRIEEAHRAYDLLNGDAASLGILLTYGTEAVAMPQTVRLTPPAGQAAALAPAGRLGVSFVGAGNYASAVLIPAFKAAGVRLRSVASSAGVSGLHAARKFGFEETTTDTQCVLSDPDTDVVVISTRHDSHAELVCRALAAGKHVYVEKPLALSADELVRIQAAYAAAAQAGNAPLLTVGFNRRAAPHIRKIKALLDGVQVPKAFVVSVNAGSIPAEHWTQSLAVGGGRILGEACHFVDLLRFLAGSRIEHYSTTRMSAATTDTASMSLGFADGSIGTVHYFANGSKSFPKERLEVFCAGRVLQLDNYRRLTGFGWAGLRSARSWKQDKGQRDFVRTFLEAIRDGVCAPIPFEELLEVARVTIELGQGT